MRCEICGKKISEHPLKTKIDGSIMNVCKNCSKFGKIQREPPKPSKSRSRPRVTRKDEPTYDILEDYSGRIREAREKKGWSREDLAKKIYEKVSVINRIETGKMVPDIKLARKIEKILNITLIEKLEDNTNAEFKAASMKRSTIGDIALIKKR